MNEANPFVLARKKAGLTREYVMDNIDTYMSRSRVESLENGSTPVRVEDIIILNDFYQNDIVLNYYVEALYQNKAETIGPQKKSGTPVLEKYLILREPSMTVKEYMRVCEISSATAADRIAYVRERMKKHGLVSIKEGSVLTRTFTEVHGISMNDFVHFPEIELYLERERCNAKL